jgi:hypothetical protein
LFCFYQIFEQPMSNQNASDSISLDSVVTRR